LRLFRSVPTGTVRRTRRFRAGGAVGLALLGLSLAGCAPDNTPKEYGADVEKSFVEFCSGNINPVDGVTTTIATNTYCRCAYNVFKDNVPYNDEDKTSRFSGKYADDKPTFLALNNDLQNDPGKIDQLPDDVKNKLRACPKVEENITSGSVPSGTTPGTAATTTGSTPA